MMAKVPLRLLRQVFGSISGFFETSYFRRYTTVVSVSAGSGVGSP